MDIWSKSTLKSLLVPGGVLLLLAAILLSTGRVTIPASVVQFSYYAVFGTGVLLAWRFHSSRVFFALITLLLAHLAVEFFAAGRISSSGPGHIALQAVAVLLPLNFIAFSLTQERGFSLPANLPAMALLFFESVLVAVICRPGETTTPAFLTASLVSALAVAGAGFCRGFRSFAYALFPLSQARRKRTALVTGNGISVS